jgi:hypothetical protein
MRFVDEWAGTYVLIIAWYQLRIATQSSFTGLPVSIADPIGVAVDADFIICFPVEPSTSLPPLPSLCRGLGLGIMVCVLI